MHNTATKRWSSHSSLRGVLSVDCLWRIGQSLQQQGPGNGRRLTRKPRGEIATRIIQSAREAGIETYALVTTNDTSHALSASRALELPSPASYLDISALVRLVKQHKIDAIHPGYGFLSESPEFARRAWDEAGALVVGPGPAILERTGDKLAAKKLALECDVPTLPATTTPTSSVDDVHAFIKSNGLPVMLKAVDGGGGKGIRLVRRGDEVDNAARRATAESPSHQFFVEKAAVDGYRHIEVQILGDGSGQVAHLFERECSIQRRYQKIVELAPSSIADRKFVARIIDAALRMARHVRYMSLGTFEFLANDKEQEFFFLEVNPRLQVEHTISESLTGIDIVRTQLDIAQGASLAEAALGSVSQDPVSCPRGHAVQLRVTAENVHSDWSLSIGRLSSFRWPSGNGVRIDTALAAGHPAIVTADFDSLLAKIVITAGSWRDAVSKCQRALADAKVEGVRSNLDVLRAITASEDFSRGACDTTWLEANLQALLKSGEQLSREMRPAVSFDGADTSNANLSGVSSSTVVLRKGDAWALSLSPSDDSTSEKPETHHLKLTRVLRNEFPSRLRAEIEYSTPGSEAVTCVLDATASTASSSAVTSAGRRRRGDANNPRHIIVPFSGKLVEVLVDEGDRVASGQVVCVVQQMKMELEVRARVGGHVRWVTDAEDGEDVAEGLLAAELESGDTTDSDKAKL